ncbi:hypothetical protein [Chryseobacterium cucumeris]|uniref:hypothetical protein n=1 Tax=Chryseobacterium cucumeris TaxID=1813611 RepID=UPI003D99A6B8
MDIKLIKKELNEIKNVLLHNTIMVECYLFGSILKEPKFANDLDILIIYKNIDHVKYIKESFSSFSAIYPLHLIFFSYSEEKEFNFIKQQNAEIVFSL